MNFRVGDLLVYGAVGEVVSFRLCVGIVLVGLSS